MNSDLEPRYLSSSASESEASEIELAHVGNNNTIPGGLWSDRKFSYSRVLKMLFKKQFVLKFRKVSAIVEMIIALVFYFILYPLDLVCQRNIAENLNTTTNYTQTWSLNVGMMFLMSNKSRLSAMPDNQMMRTMMGQFAQTYLSMTTIQVEYKNSVKEVRSYTDGTEFSGLGIIWHNSDQPNALTHPNIEVYCQSLLDCPSADIFRWIRGYLFQVGAQLEMAKPIEQQNAKLMIAPLMNSSATRYPIIKGQAMYDENFVFMIFIIVPVIVATMPDFEAVLDEKDTKVASLAFLNGCPESAYWIVSIVTPFVISFFPYFFACIIFCYWFRFTTVDFSLLLFISVIFILGHIFFQYWISTFMRKGSSGRSFTIIMLVAALFFGIIHMFASFDGSQRGKAVQHVFSIIPFSCYQLIIGSLYNNGIQKQRHIGWSNLNDEVLPYPLSIGIMWMMIDMVVYFLLFLICNACNSRNFGTPLIKWSELFSLNAWRRVFKNDEQIKEAELNCPASKLISVSGLEKTYKNGSKNVLVFDGAEFSVDEGEVIVIIGPNGAGKSTLVNILAGAIEPDGGTLEFNGEKPTKRFKAMVSCLGVVFQENIIFNRLSVREHLELWAAFKGVSEENLKDSIDYYAENLQLTHMLDNFAGDLSGGQKRKLCIAMALLGNPPIVIMDEPTAGVDVQARQLIWKTIASLDKTTSLVTSHALEEAEAVSSRLFIVSNHSIPFCGTSTELRNKYQCGYLLRVGREDGTVGPVLQLVQSFIPSAHITDERKDIIALPVDHSVAQMLQALKAQKEELGVDSYSFSVEQLEDMLLKLIETGADLAQ